MRTMVRMLGMAVRMTIMRVRMPTVVVIFVVVRISHMGGDQRGGSATTVLLLVIVDSNLDSITNPIIFIGFILLIKLC